MRNQVVAILAVTSFAGQAALCIGQTEYTLWNNDVFEEDNYWVYSVTEDGGEAESFRREITNEINFLGDDVLVVEEEAAGSFDTDTWYIQRDGEEIFLFFYRDELDGEWQTFRYYDGLSQGVLLLPKTLDYNGSPSSLDNLAESSFAWENSDDDDDNGDYDSEIAMTEPTEVTVGAGTFDVVRFQTRTTHDFGSGDYILTESDLYYNRYVGMVKANETVTTFDNNSEVSSVTRVYELTESNLEVPATPTPTVSPTVSPTATASPSPTEATPTVSPTQTTVPASSDPAVVFADLSLAQWENTNDSPDLPMFDDPDFAETRGLEMYVGDPINTFGFWQTRELLDPLPAGDYLIRFHIQGVRQDSFTRLPEVRYRVFKADSTQSNMGVLAEISLGQGYPQTFDIYWVSDGTTQWRVAVDLLSFVSDLRGGLIVEEIEAISLD